MPDYIVDESPARRYTTVGVVNRWERMPLDFIASVREGSPLTPYYYRRDPSVSV